MKSSQGSCAPGSSCGCSDRRSFLKLTGLTALSFAAADPLHSIAGPFEPKDTADHFVPADKKLKPDWIQSLFAKGEPTWYRGEDLRMFAMPVGGIGAGQLYLTGEGRLVHWDIFNSDSNYAPTADTHYQRLPSPAAPLQQGFAIRVRTKNRVLVRNLDRAGFPGVQARGEYPIGRVRYADPNFPVTVELEAFSPFIPLNAADSALPATVLQFRVKNQGTAKAEVTLAGWLENGVCCHTGEVYEGVRRHQLVQRGNLTMILGSARAIQSSGAALRPAHTLADFEQDNYGDWKAEGTAFGKQPARGTLPNQQPVTGFQGKGLVNTFLQGDPPQGTLTSPLFVIDRAFLNFLIGGGGLAGKTCINLLVEGKVVRTATGKNVEALTWSSWNVRELQGRQAQIQIVDKDSGPWGHVNIDQMELSDAPRRGQGGPLETQHDFGTMGLGIISGKRPSLTVLDLPDHSLSALLQGESALASAKELEKPFSSSLCAALGQKVSLKPGQETVLTFVVTWHFPNRAKNGNYYATRHTNALAVAEYTAKHLDRLAGQTRLWRDTWYDSTLPTWLLDRLFAPVSILASSTCQWWANGRFWAWEGVRCCEGTCAHVWNYEHAMARLFPDLERSVREMQDFGTGFVEATGAIHFRGESNDWWAGDSQGGTVLKCLREHQMSKDPTFLKRNWPRIKKTVEFLLKEDGNQDGLLEGSQHNTYDINFEGANTMVGSLYLGALRAAEEMAKEVGDTEFAALCRKVFTSGAKLSVDRLYNGEYFIQKVDLQKHPKHQYADGCLADQMFGQGWAHQVGLGYLYPKETVLSSLRAIWTYDWAPDIGPQNAAHPPQRWFARPGEAGLFTCTWPKSKHLGPESVLYRDEIWTGIEYQVAGHMAWEGMLQEALAICRGIHDRYHPARQNPWNEVECGDHYARAMASYGVFLGLCGFEAHGPKGHLGFAPRITPGDFRGAFTCAEGWGTYRQRTEGTACHASLEVKWGQVRLRSLALACAPGVTPAKVTVRLQGKDLPASLRFEEGRMRINLASEVTILPGQTLSAICEHR